MRFCAVILLATACTHHPQTRTLLPDTPSMKAVAQLRDGREVDVVATSTPEGLRWIARGGPRTRTGRVVDPADMRSYTTLRRGRGLGEGIAICGLAGIALGALIGLSSGRDHCADDSVCLIEFTARQKAVVDAFGLGSLGVGLGALFGAAAGSRDVHELDTNHAPRVTPMLGPGRAGGALSWSF
jgi:hypothetical protein